VLHGFIIFTVPSKLYFGTSLVYSTTVQMDVGVNTYKEWYFMFGMLCVLLNAFGV